MEERMTNMANPMAIAMAVVSEPFKPHSTPLQTTTSVAAACGVSGSGFHPSHGEFGVAVAAKADEKPRLGGVR